MIPFGRFTIGTAALWAGFFAATSSAPVCGQISQPAMEVELNESPPAVRSVLKGVSVPTIAEPFLQAGEEPPGLGLPGSEQGWLDDCRPAPPLPAPNGWLPHFPFLDLRRAIPDDPGRHVGWGWPLEGTSWLNRPWHVGWFVGALGGDELIEGRVRQQTDLFGGYRLGYDLNHFWGTEGRFGFANLPLTDSPIPPRDRTSRDWFWDAHLLYYPWGDARWRPFFSAGLGWAEFRFQDDNGRSFQATTFHLPFGVGVKYYFRNWLALRVDLLDNLAFSSNQVDTMHNLSATCGVEVHFGGRRRSYYPWNPGINLW